MTALKTQVRESIKTKYKTTVEQYNIKVVNDIIYNEPTHLVSVFKDFLINDDISEFMKRTYTENESVKRLPKIYSFYDNFAKVFPNYVVLQPESRYMFKNIENK
jgi:hypothetical protein